MFGRLVWVGGRSTEGLPFSPEVLQCACQGDAKKRGPQTSIFAGLAPTGPPNHERASPVTLRILLSNLLQQSADQTSNPHQTCPFIAGSLQIRISVL